MPIYCQKIEAEYDSDSDDGRLASLDALRMALSTAPFFKHVHNIAKHPNDAFADYYSLPDKCAIHMKNVTFSYKQKPVLNQVNIQVPKGRIYALLGSSSCGKTTLLKCLIGRLIPKSGEIRVFGTNTKLCPVPGIGVGYMPQKIALYNELTIDETLQYYGYLYQVPMAIIYQRVNFLLSLFNLPDENRLISDLTENHRWRISLAVSLIHSPPLLLLDEPTVNVDPLIRKSIWDHLNCLCKEEGLTVLITTHYVEEADAAYKIGLMRRGRILAEDRPEDLFKQFNTRSFDNLYLKLCQIDTDCTDKKVNPLYNNNNNHCKSALPMAEWPLCERRLSEINNELISFNLIRFLAFLKKNVYILRGNLFVMLFFFIFPSLQLILFCSSFGREVHDIPVAVFASEKSGHLSRQFLRSLDFHIISQHKYPTLHSAISAVERGHAWAAIVLSDNYSELINHKYNSRHNFTPQEERDSTVKLYTDLSNAVIGQQLLYSIFRSVKAFLTTISNKYLAKYSSPIVIEKVIYGSQSANFMEFLVPGYIIAIIFVSPMLLTAYLLIKDQQNGLLERCLSTGASGLEVLLSHFITQLKVLALQELLVLTVAFVIFKIPIKGPVGPLIAIVYMQGVVGISFGLLISAICPNAITALLLTSGAVIPGVFLSGITWPIESMPPILKIVSYALPLTQPIESLRCIISRGVTLSYFKVLISFAISSIYCVVITLMAIIIFKCRTAS